MKRFVTLLAVDTNTKVISGTRVSMCACILIRDIKVDVQTGRWDAKVADQDSFEFHDAGVYPEQVGWWLLIDAATKAGMPQPIGIVTDHDLNSLTELNARHLQFASREIFFSLARLIDM